MKKIIAASALILVLSGASAQFRGERGFAFAPRTSVVVAASPYWGYSPYVGFGLGFYPYYGYPYYPYGAYGYRPYSQLDKQIAEINHDYDQRIEAVRSDNTLSGKERRSEIRELKKEKDNTIDNAKRNYFNSLRNQQSPQQQAPPVQQQAPQQEAVPQTSPAEPQNNTGNSTGLQ